ncbi:MAG TPA: hypothetical protein VK575_09445 [Gemmatimonadaceae bacterium]|jgi:hypothetical protein|nr:hypothetical protein [Gemmatimonadaceae bacterium]
MRYFILDADKRPVPTNMATWARTYKHERVALTEVTNGVDVSTVFLGVDHRFSSKGPPLLFETMVFGGPLDQQCWRYSSWDDAETGHAAAVRKCKNLLKVEKKNI